MPEQIRIALPSKGRMEEETLDFLAGCGLRVTKTNPRQYVASLPTLPDVLVLFQRARDIPVSVAAGDVDLGITGYDALSETIGPQPDGVVVIHDSLGYGECALVLAVPEEWDDVQSVRDLARRAAERPLRVATKYETSVTRFLADAGVENVRVVAGRRRAGIRAHGRVCRFHRRHHQHRHHPARKSPAALEDGTLLTSQAILIGNRAALSSRPDVLAATRKMLEFIEAHLRARGQYMIFANMRASSAHDIGKRVFSQPDLGGLQGPTLAPMVTRDGSGQWWAINLVSIRP